MRAAWSHVINLVKRADYEAYVWCIQLPKVMKALQNVLAKLHWVLATVLDWPGDMCGMPMQLSTGRCCLLQELRAPILALRAFNAETAAVGDHAKSEMMVLMRFQVGLSLSCRPNWRTATPSRVLNASCSGAWRKTS